jgi:hypothetical protein
MQRFEEAIEAGLLDAQRKASELFAAVASQQLIRPGSAETEINEAIRPCGAAIWHHSLLAQTYRARWTQYSGTLP